jgi:hypothetical protein
MKYSTIALANWCVIQTDRAEKTVFHPKFKIQNSKSVLLPLQNKKVVKCIGHTITVN